MAGWVKFYAFASGDVLGRILTASDTMSGSGDIVVGDRVCCDLGIFLLQDTDTGEKWQRGRNLDWRGRRYGALLIWGKAELKEIVTCLSCLIHASLPL